ncbi:DUF397 domain-containing protein [Actinokineospora globicatena]|uniref:DUF397 domain-containing protein n=1 Tax=Actinokineospora globicatena TaxID=103729 RepID=UPI0020A3BF20|nr:DUF397 domain-containing protein [Actinokineospora globicatena]MCP2305682.1 protein of unknown function (DUF397) [Actinokineospora globicatena]GLW81552.1 hypothetical protein Aglo01_60330 [Actinokineospora globicatena]GLW87750.1 hypothetical protein Aglo02_53890 [Actinokineospora globicatena]
MDTGWFKSSRSAAAEANCVEVRLTPTTIAIRDTKNRTAGTLSLHPTTWAAFLTTTKNA